MLRTGLGLARLGWSWVECIEGWFGGDLSARSTDQPARQDKPRREPSWLNGIECWRGVQRRSQSVGPASVPAPTHRGSREGQTVSLSMVSYGTHRGQRVAGRGYPDKRNRERILAISTDIIFLASIGVFAMLSRPWKLTNVIGRVGPDRTGGPNDRRRGRRVIRCNEFEWDPVWPLGILVVPNCSCASS